ncbi:hypothetical protein R9X49_21385 [Pectobacterium carotovorum]|uniref:hypothetical protein n=1 Tax=Pectobacterium carotovorum TaxID=554 RepID=UPI0029D4FDE6|nr:hypothetical protein [Pectobacterium carotovorum]MDX6917659.1 hypothetical protein [Pectobacterium carotovorum]
MDGKEALHHLTIQQNNIGKTMDVLFEVFLPKNIKLNKFGWEEVYTEWGGQQYSQEPAVYKWNDLLLFEGNKDVLSYERLLGRSVSLTNYCAYTLKSSSLFDLEQCVNKKLDVSNNAVFLFFDNLLKNVEHWVVLTLIDWDQFDEIYNVSNEKEALFFLMESLNWNEPKGIALIKN